MGKTEKRYRRRKRDNFHYICHIKIVILSSTRNCFDISYIGVWAELSVQSCLKTGPGWNNSSLPTTGVQKSSGVSDSHHLSSQARTRPLLVLWPAAASNEQPAEGAAHLAFGQPPRIDTHAAGDVLQKQNYKCCNRALYTMIMQCSSPRVAAFIVN